MVADTVAEVNSDSVFCVQTGLSSAVKLLQLMSCKTDGEDMTAFRTVLAHPSGYASHHKGPYYHN
jgi:hypothetical protein